MDPKSIPPQLERVLRASTEYATRTREGLRSGLGDARAGSLRAPPAAEHARRFLYGFALPATLARVVWRDRSLRSSMTRRLLPPVALIAIVAFAGVTRLIETLGATWRDPAVLVAERDDAGDSGEARGAPEATSFGAVRLASRLVQSRLAKLVATLAVLEWILVWIGREHHEVIAAEACRLTGVPSEAPPDPPRLRFDLGWLRLKGWRALRFLLFLTLDAPAVWLVGRVPVMGGALGLGVEAIWFSYWAAVFAIANSFLAWAPRTTADAAPWFARALAAAGRVPVVGVLFRAYGWVLTTATRGVWPACVVFEQTVWESLGLALARGIASIPVLYILSRPLFTPAATHALVARCRPAPSSARDDAPARPGQETGV